MYYKRRTRTTWFQITACYKNQVTAMSVLACFEFWYGPAIAHPEQVSCWLPAAILIALTQGLLQRLIEWEKFWCVAMSPLAAKGNLFTGIRLICSRTLRMVPLSAALKVEVGISQILYHLPASEDYSQITCASNSLVCHLGLDLKCHYWHLPNFSHGLPIWWKTIWRTTFDCQLSHELVCIMQKTEL